MRRRTAAAVAIAAAMFTAAGPVAAIETKDLGLEPVRAGEQGGRQSLRVAITPGSKTKDAVRVWNKTDRPLTVELRATAAKTDADGSVALGGDAEAASWIDVADERLTLPPRGERVVRITVDAPDELPALETTAAILVQPVVDRGAPPAILQRVAVMTYLSSATLHAPPGAGTALPPWLIAVAVLLALAATALAARRVLSLRVAPPTVVTG